MRVVLDYRPALRARTGVGEFVHELARRLAVDDIAGGSPARDEVVLFTSSWKDRPSPAWRREVPGALVVDRRIPVRVLTWMWNRAGWPPIEMFAGECDVVHAQMPLLIPARRAAQVVTIHDLDFLHHPERAEAEMRRDFPALAAAHVARADHVVVSSHYSAREVERHLQVSSARIGVCSPGAPAWAAEVAADGRRLAAGSHILFVGTLEPRKNVGVLIDAYRALVSERPDAPPLVVAGRMTATGEAWRRAVSRAGLDNRVSFLGYVEDRQRPRLYAAARMLVLPSLEEGFGFPVLEAMACGVPVVISNRGSLPEVAGDAAEAVDPADVDGFSARMRALLDDGAAAAAAERGRARAARYSWSSCANAARTAYRAAIDHAHRR